MRRSVLRARWIAAATVAAVSVLACAPEADRIGVGEPRLGGTAVVIEGTDLDKPMPVISESNLDNQLGSVLYRSVLETWWENGELHYLTNDRAPMALARGYEFFGPDSASLRYNLVTDALWSDGQPITAHDVVWTIETAGDPRVASPRQNYNRLIREIYAENDSTVVIHFERRYPEIFFHTAGAVAPRHLYADHDPALLRSHSAVVRPDGGAMVVSGPFMIGEWIRGQRVTLLPNPNSHLQPRLERVVIRVVPEATTRLIELRTGNADYMYRVPFDQVEPLRRAGIRMEVQEKRFYEYVAYNPRAGEHFADPEVRRALGLAIDREGLIRALQMDDFAIPAGGPYAPIFRRLYDPHEQAPLPYDPDEALRILQEKGWQRGADGILQRNGAPFRFTMVTNSDNPRRVDGAQIIQQQFRRIGVDARIQLLEFNTFVERQTSKNFEVVLGGWGVGLSPDLRQVWGDPELPFNLVSYDNARVRELMDRATNQLTEESAAPYWKQAAAQIVADQPYTWLYYLDEIVAVNDRLQGTVINTLGRFQNIWEWWVTDGAAPDAGTAAAPAS